MNSVDLYDYLSKYLLENPLISFDSIYYAEKKRRSKKSRVPVPEQIPWNSLPTEETNSELQLLTMGLDTGTEKIAHNLCKCIDDRGYLDIVYGFELEKHCDIKKFNRALEALRSLEPAGVGVLDLRDCLLLQIVRQGKLTLLTISGTILRAGT